MPRSPTGPTRESGLSEFKSLMSCSTLTPVGQRTPSFTAINICTFKIKTLARIKKPPVWTRRHYFSHSYSMSAVKCLRFITIWAGNNKTHINFKTSSATSLRVCHTNWEFAYVVPAVNPRIAVLKHSRSLWRQPNTTRNYRSWVLSESGNNFHQWLLLRLGNSVTGPLLVSIARWCCFSTLSSVFVLNLIYFLPDYTFDSKLPLANLVLPLPQRS